MNNKIYVTKILKNGKIAFSIQFSGEGVFSAIWKYVGRKAYEKGIEYDLSDPSLRDEALKILDELLARIWKGDKRRLREDKNYPVNVDFKFNREYKTSMAIVGEEGDELDALKFRQHDMHFPLEPEEIVWFYDILSKLRS